MDATIDIVNNLMDYSSLSGQYFDPKWLMNLLKIIPPATPKILNNTIMKYGTKDLMRITDIRKKSDGDIVQEFKLALAMANSIELPGKAIARGWAAVEVYRNQSGNPDQYSPIAAIFFQKACELAGEDDINDIQAMASSNTVGDSVEDVEAAYANVPIEKQPASRRTDNYVHGLTKKKTSNLLSLAKINILKGEGPNFNIFYTKTGTVEIWKNEEDKIRMIYTGSPEPTGNIGDIREFKFEDKRETWTMVDYTDVYNMLHLMPLYGASLTSFMYN